MEVPRKIHQNREFQRNSWNSFGIRDFGVFFEVPPPQNHDFCEKNLKSGKIKISEHWKCLYKGIFRSRSFFDD